MPGTVRSPACSDLNLNLLAVYGKNRSSLPLISLRMAKMPFYVFKPKIQKSSCSETDNNALTSISVGRVDGVSHGKIIFMPSVHIHMQTCPAPRTV